MKRRDFVTNFVVFLAGYNFIFSDVLNPYSFLNHKENSNLTQFEISELTINDLQELMKTGKSNSEKITELYLNRIEDIDKNGPAINSVIEINPEAISIAKKMDIERKEGKIRSQLHGIPVLIKDNIDTADQMMTTAGSLALLNHKASKDAFIVKKLREAGAVILGKTNLSEWANFRSTRSVSGWSSRGGQTKNPYVLDRSPCGSSSGSGAAVAANLCTIAVGTETDGSISCPASMNSVVGIKPTVGLVSRSGIIPISKTQDTAGPLTRTVRDAAILLSIIAGSDPDDIAVIKNNKNHNLDYTQFLDLNSLMGKRIGVEKSFLNKHEALDKLLKEALEQMKSKGAIIVELNFIDAFNKIGIDENKVLQYEFKEGLNKYLSSANVSVKSIQELIEFDKINANKLMPYFQQEILDSTQLRGNLNNPDYINAINKYAEARSYYNK
ncbi:MAG TPA: amidase, partial [Saprospiraceae bacterium]|nr:amidase [Saprospiraceae bacterium]